MAMTITPQDETEFETAGRRRKITKFALAGVAVLGVGAALTSAAWTDNVFFGGSASSGTAVLEGSLDNINFVESEDPSNPTLVISDFVIGPDSVETKAVWVQNVGTLDVRLSTISAVGTGPLFDSGADVTAVTTDADNLLAPNQKARINVEVSGNPLWTDTFMQGQTSANNSILVTVQGSTDLTP